MKKNTGNLLSMLAILPEGKVENDIRITDKVITGICTVYAKRSDNENEFLLRTIGVVSPDHGNLTEAVQIAIEQAYLSAMNQIAGGSEHILSPSPEEEITQSVSNSDLEVKASNTQPISVESEHTSIFSESEQAASEGIVKIEFADKLFSDSDEPEYQKALDTEINIFGKLHLCNGWKAGKILAEHPEMIVDFCTRNSDSYDGPKYTGPRIDQKEALFKLYPAALLRTQKTA